MSTIKKNDVSAKKKVTTSLPKVNTSKDNAQNTNSKSGSNTKTNEVKKTSEKPSQVQKLPVIQTTSVTSKDIQPPITSPNENEVDVNLKIEPIPINTDLPQINSDSVNPVAESSTSVANTDQTVEITVVDAILNPPIIIPVNNNGKVVLIYEQYNEQFPITNGTITSESIDDVYCLSFVMPNCLIHLSKHEPKVKNQLEVEGNYNDLFLDESPRGTFHNLVDDATYYVYVEQEAAQLERDMKKMKQMAIKDVKKTDDIIRDDGRNLESCSCIYGNPCVDEYGCKDWSNRYAIAKKNGWKGF